MTTLGLFRRNAETGLPIDLGQAFGQAFALRVDQGGGARAGDGIGGAPQGDLARQRRADHARLDAAVVGKPARISIAIALDQAGAFGDFQRQCARLPRGLGDQAEPGLDLRLFLFEAVAVRAKPAQFGQHQEAQIAANRGGVDLHAENDASWTRSSSRAIRRMREGAILVCATRTTSSYDMRTASWRATSLSSRPGVPHAASASIKARSRSR